MGCTFSAAASAKTARRSRGVAPTQQASRSKKRQTLSGRSRTTTNQSAPTHSVRDDVAVDHSEQQPAAPLPQVPSQSSRHVTPKLFENNPPASQATSPLQCQCRGAGLTFPPPWPRVVLSGATEVLGHCPELPPAVAHQVSPHGLRGHTEAPLPLPVLMLAPADAPMILTAGSLRHLQLLLGGCVPSASHHAVMLWLLYLPSVHEAIESIPMRPALTNAETESGDGASVSSHRGSACLLEQPCETTPFD